MFEDGLEREDLRIDAVDEGQHVDVEILLQVRHLVERVEDLLREGFLLEVDHDTHAVLVGLVAQILDPLELVFLHEVGDLHDERGLVGRVGHLGHDDLELSGLVLDDLRLGARHDRSLAGGIGFADVLLVVDDAARRKVRPLHELHEVLDTRLRMIDEVTDTVDEFVEIVRRDIGRHTDRDTDRTVEEELRELGREDQRLVVHPVEVGDEVHCVLFDIEKHLLGNGRELGFGVTVGRGAVAVHRAEVSLSPHQRVAEREILRHADHRVIHRRIAMRVVFTEHLTDHGG